MNTTENHTWEREMKTMVSNQVHRLATLTCQSDIIKL